MSTFERYTTVRCIWTGKVAWVRGSSGLEPGFVDVEWTWGAWSVVHVSNLEELSWVLERHDANHQRMMRGPVARGFRLGYLPRL